MKKSLPLTLSSKFVVPHPALIGLLAFALLTGCSSVKTQVDKGSINARTFSFMDPGSRQPPQFAESSRQAHELVQTAIAKNLAARGIALRPTGGEITVAYLIVVGNNVATTSLNTYFGYTEDASAFVDKVHREQTGSSANRAYFEAGTLVIDFVDPATSRLMQRRSIQAEVLRNLSMEARASRVQQLVDEALKTVPISSTGAQP